MKKKNKFNVGDLVKLSAAGRKTQQNSHLRDGFGIICEIDPRYAVTYPIKVAWVNECYPKGTTEARFKPYELKFFKK